jgi:hypothetical protein
MPNGGDLCDHDLARAMTQVVLQDILNSVIEEFEKHTDSRIGTITIGPRQDERYQRIVTAEIIHTGDKCITGLAQYRQILCDHQLFREMPVCTPNDSDPN